MNRRTPRPNRKPKTKAQSHLRATQVFRTFVRTLEKLDAQRAEGEGAR